MNVVLGGQEKETPTFGRAKSQRKTKPALAKSNAYCVRVVHIISSNYLPSFINAFSFCIFSLAYIFLFFCFGQLLPSQLDFGTLFYFIIDFLYECFASLLLFPFFSSTLSPVPPKKKQEKIKKKQKQQKQKQI